MGVGEMSPEEFTAFLSQVNTHLLTHSMEGSVHFQCMDWRHMREMLSAGYGSYNTLLNCLCWNKQKGGMGSLYRSAHEMIFVWKKGTAPHVNNIELGKHGRYRSNVLDYPGLSQFGPGREEDLAGHPTVKPIALVFDLILDVSHRDEIVLDPFLGSGTTILAAHRAGRRGFGIEIDPLYVDLALRRLQARTGIKPVLAQTGEGFEDVKARRGSEASVQSEAGNG